MITELIAPMGPYRLAFWNAAQIHHFLQATPDPQAYVRQWTTFEEYCTGMEPLPQVLSKMYALLNNPPEQPSLPCLSKWEADLHRTFTKTQIQNMINYALKSSLCTKIQETNYKILTRWYLTPSWLHTIVPDTPEHCWRGCTDRGTILQIFWLCQKLHAFWTAVSTISQKFTDFKIPDDPTFFLLHVSTLLTKSYKKSILHHLLNAAKSCIPLLWKWQDPPTTAAEGGGHKQDGRPDTDSAWQTGDL